MDEIYNHIIWSVRTEKEHSSLELTNIVQTINYHLVTILISKKLVSWRQGKTIIGLGSDSNLDER